MGYARTHKEKIKMRLSIYLKENKAEQLQRTFESYKDKNEDVERPHSLSSFITYLLFKQIKLEELEELA
jgi:hypothetical protein